MTLAIATGSASTHAAGAAGKSAPLNVAEAKALADAVFAERWKATISKHKVRQIKDEAESEQWIFFYEGVEEFARPGYHAVVKINKKTGKVETIPGM